MDIYLVRHGQTQWNKKKIMQGHKDSPLTAKGIKNAEKLGRFLAKEGIGIIFTSDLGRCLKTAEIINKYLKVKVIKTRRLRERNFGKFNGRPEGQARKFLGQDLSVKPEGGENERQVEERTIEFLKSVSSKNFKRVLLVAHHGTVLGISQLYFKEKEKAEKVPNKPECIYRFKLEANKIKSFKFQKV